MILLKSDGTGDGNGYGNGYGDGDGYGYGTGDGYGNGYTASNLLQTICRAAAVYLVRGETK